MLNFGEVHLFQEAWQLYHQVSCKKQALKISGRSHLEGKRVELVVTNVKSFERYQLCEDISIDMFDLVKSQIEDFQFRKSSIAP